MAIAFRSTGTTTKVDTSATGTSPSVSMPAGHVSNDLLLMPVFTDDNTGVATPSGWNRLFYIAAGTSQNSPYQGWVHCALFYRIDNGSLGSSVTLSASSSSWPTGKPYVLSWIEAYSGCDTANPIGEWSTSTTQSSTAAQAHPALSTALANCWLLTLRGVGSDSQRTFTDSVGTDVERVDDWTGFTASPSAALYDSNAALGTGAQTQRTTTASGTVGYGSTMASIVIRPAAVATGAVAPAQTATISFTAGSPAAATAQGPWDLCNQLPVYDMGIDWNLDGSFGDPSSLGFTYGQDTFSRTISSSWGSADTGDLWTVSGGSASDFSVGSGVGVHSCSTKNVFRFSTAESPSADVDEQVDFSTSATALTDSIYVFLIARHTDGNNFYFARCQMTPAGAMVLSLRKRTTAGGEVQLSTFTTGLTHTASTFYTLRLRVDADMLRAKLWQTGTTEPDWQTAVTDEDIIVAGNVGVRTLIGSSSTNTLPVVISFDNFRSSEPLDNEGVTSDILGDVVISYGRDQERQLSPAAIGTASVRLCNVTRIYSPENVNSPLYGNLDPARDSRFQVTWAGTIFPLFRGRVDDFGVNASFSDRTVSFSFLDGMALLQGAKLSTQVFASLRTGELINEILDEAGWTGPRDIDTGATIVKFWWAENTDALSAIQDLVKSEGPPAVAFVGPDGTFTFHDRHHRIQNVTSTNVQATFGQAAIGCAAPAVTGLSIAQPFVYDHGWRDIVNSITFEVGDRVPDPELTDVWTSEDSIVLSDGQSVDIDISTSDPFTDAVTPVEGTDFVRTGAGAVSVLLSRTSGASAKITVMASGGGAVITGMKLRARAIPVAKTIKVTREDTGSITAHGEKTYPDTAPWANANDAGAIADMILLHYARRRPTIQLRAVTQNPNHFVQLLQRTIGDRIRVRNDELGLSGDFFIERVTHTIRRFNAPGRPPVHDVVFGCEKEQDIVANPFTFDKRGAGFDDGTFDAVLTDSASAVFTFDDATQGQFNFGQFGT